MAKKKIKRDPLSFWSLISPNKSSNITWEIRKKFLWLHFYGLIGWCLHAYVAGLCLYFLYLVITK